MYYEHRASRCIRPLPRPQHAGHNRRHDLGNAESGGPLSQSARATWSSLVFMLSVLAMVSPCVAVTDITLQNCPSQYNITKANQTTDADARLINAFYSGFSTSADSARVEEIVLTGNRQELQSYIR